jgi:hypothetical protein
MATYVGAAEEFGRSAQELLQHLSLLPQVRNAYQQAMTASAELRTVLDNGDEKLRILMSQLEQALSAPLGKPALSEIIPEVVKVRAETMRASAASAGAGTIGVVKTLP